MLDVIYVAVKTTIPGEHESVSTS